MQMRGTMGCTRIIDHWEDCFAALAPEHRVYIKSGDRKLHRVQSFHVSATAASQLLNQAV
jgi:hypothetical protein